MSGLVLKKDWNLFRQAMLIGFGALALIVAFIMRTTESNFYALDSLDVFGVLLAGFLGQFLFLTGDHGTLELANNELRLLHAILGAIGLGYLGYVWLDVTVAVAAAFWGLNVPSVLCWAGPVLGIPLGFLLCNALVNTWGRFRQAQFLSMALILVASFSLLFEYLAEALSSSGQGTQPRYVPEGLLACAIAGFFVLPAPLLYLLIFRKSFRIESIQASAREKIQAEKRADLQD